MTPVSYITRALLILVGAFVGFAVVNFTSMRYTEIAFSFLVTIMIPLAMVVYEYLANPKV